MPLARTCQTVVLVGNESAGKSQLVASLTGRTGSTGAFRGTTVACRSYRVDGVEFVDTPGILRESDSQTTALALDRLSTSERVLLVVKATHLDDEIRDLLPLVGRRRGAVVVTFWDYVADRAEARDRLLHLEAELQVPMVPVDGRHLTGDDRRRIQEAVREGSGFSGERPRTKVGWRIEPRRGPLDIPVLAQVLAIALLILPAWLAVTGANRLADALYDSVAALFASSLAWVERLPAPLAEVLGGDYGVISMGPFLLLYAVPTLLVFALLLATYKTSGLIDRLTVALHPVVRPFGLSGRDLVRVIMGFGCNVPAVINTRACSSCSRGTCISAISFGSACSYQLPATMAVFAAAGLPGLAIPYLLVLAATTGIFLRLTAPRAARSAANRLTLMGRDFLQWPSAAGLWRETWGVVGQFFRVALPVFLLICALASAAESIGLLDWLSRNTEPLMALFRLPGEASVAVVLGAVRKDGIAIGLLDGGWESLKVPLTSPVQVLTAVYLAGVLMPCLVTLLTVAREMNVGFALRMVGRQVTAAIVFSIVIAWSGSLLF